MSFPVAAAETVPLERDLGPLAWVDAELRRGFDAAVKSLRRFLREAEQSGRSDLESLDSTALRIARQQLHQVAGALHMIGMEPAAGVVAAMEAVVQKLVQRPSLCTEESVATIERASFALGEYLDAVLAGKADSAVGLFPQYRDVQVLAGTERAHPADLWSARAVDTALPLPGHVVPLPYGSAARHQLDQAVLSVVKSGDAAAARKLSVLALRFASASPPGAERTFWQVCAGFFEAQSFGLLPSDLHAKRAASRVLMQYTAFVRGDIVPNERLQGDLLFFCAYARPTADMPVPALRAVQAAWGLHDNPPVNYEQRRFGRFDPAVLAQARKRIAAATETWSALAGGDRQKIKTAADQFSLVADSLQRLHPQSAPLGVALTQALDNTLRTGEAPPTALAMEVATSVLYLQAAYEELDTPDDVMAERATILAERLRRAPSAAQPEPLDQWMEDLYRRVSDRQTMGSVVEELRASLRDTEQLLDQFFRQQDDSTPLAAVPGRLAQMRGVLSVLGLDQATLAVVRMRDGVERLLVGEPTDRDDRSKVVESLGSTLGSLGFLIDMLGYQPALARQLFVYDEGRGELRVVMDKKGPPPTHALPDPAALALPGAGRATAASASLVATAPLAAPVAPADEDTSSAATVSAPAPSEPPAPLASPEPAAEPKPAPLQAASAGFGDDEDDLELREIFLDEAREVIATGREAVRALDANPADLSQQTTLRRAFHTLKGSARMVKLDQFGEAAWAMEQLCNAWLAEQQAMPQTHRALARDALQGFKRWVEDIADNEDGRWTPEPFHAAADALRQGKPPVELSLPDVDFVDFVDTVIRSDDDLADTQVDFQSTQLATGFETTEIVGPRTVMPADASADLAAPTPDQEFAEEAEIGDADLFRPLPVDDHASPAAPADLQMDEIDFSEFAAAVSEDEAAALREATGAAAVADQVDPSAQVAEIDLAPAVSPPAAEEPGGGTDLDGVGAIDALEASDTTADVLDAAEAAALEAAIAEMHEVLPIAAGLPDVSGPPAAEGALPGANLDEEASAATAQEAADPAEAMHAASAAAEDMKAIGTLRIPIPLYNVYLNEADEWSRRLVMELGEWQLELHQPLPEAAVSLAHSLAGSSATVGFHDLSGMARLLEHALQHVQLHGPGDAYQAGIFVDVAEEVRYLLHQFAAGFQKEPTPRLLRALQSIIDGESASVPSAASFLRAAQDPLPRTAESGPASVVSTEPDLAPFAVDASVDRAAAGAPALDAFSAAEQPEGELAAGTPVSAAAVAGADVADAPTPIPALAAPTDDPAPAAPAAGMVGADVPSGSFVFSAFDGADVTEAAPPASDDPEETLPFAQAVEPTAQEEAPPSEAPPMPVPAPAVEAAVPVALQVAPPRGRPLFGDEIDVTDAIDADLFPIFEEEALELLPQLGGALRQWVQRPDNHTARGEVLRALHTLKGSARLAGALHLGELAHRFETAIEELGSDVREGQQIEPLLAYSDALRANFEALRTRDEQAVVAQLDMAPPSAAVPTLLQASAEPVPARLADDGVAAVAPRGVTVPVRAPLANPMRAGAGPSVRVRSALLDRLVNQAGEVMISRSRLEVRLGQMQGSLVDLTGNLDRLRKHLRDIEVQAESQMQSRLALAKDNATNFDPLEFDRFTRVQELTRMMAESVDDVATVQRNLQRSMQGTEDELIGQGRQARELQRDLLRTRMVEFEGIADRLYAVARQAAKETGKPITLDITGGAVEMDRGVLERLAPAFEHLLRNAVVHGIEDAAIRAQAGKPATGTIAIGLQQAGNDVAVEFQDDGAGLDFERIRSKAVALGLLPEGSEQDQAALSDLIFAPGFTTAAEVTELAGRGIGMDVVRAEVQAAGGRIETHSTPGQGTRFRLVLPLTTAVTQVVMLRAGGLTIGVPTTVVEIVRRATMTDLETAYASGTFEHDMEEVPFFWAGALLQSSSRSHEPATRTRPVVVMRSAQQRVALHVDEVLGQQEVVVKNLGPQLARLPGLSGMSVLPSGAVVLIYNPVALANVHGARIRSVQAAHTQAALTDADAAAGSTAPPAAVVDGYAEVPLVLVVDDSITVRRVTQRLLRREGYRVALAADGLQALERLQEERPALVLSDIEMPRMDGFDLLRNIRADAQLHSLPVIMITSRIAAKHREHALSLGVNHYLGKPYPEEELLGLVRRYALAAAIADAAPEAR